MAYSSLGITGKAWNPSKRALARSKTDLLLLAAARAYIQHGSRDKAEIAALEALSITEDSLVREKSRFLLGELYLGRKDYKMAEEQHNLILEMNPESADAHYHLGMIWQEKGDPVRARAAWRKAVSLDPMHTAARQKLAERI
ncbi:MAG: tetratricopeptide repeat protein [Bacillus subtilis]|nr:tetratricopeptide repeat protein [Bacillus subtilis]